MNITFVNPSQLLLFFCIFWDPLVSSKAWKYRLATRWRCVKLAMSNSFWTEKNRQSWFVDMTQIFRQIQASQLPCLAWHRPAQNLSQPLKGWHTARRGQTICVKSIISIFLSEFSKSVLSALQKGKKRWREEKSFHHEEISFYSKSHRSNQKSLSPLNLSIFLLS